MAGGLRENANNEGFYLQMHNASSGDLLLGGSTILAKTNDTRRIIINARLYAPSPLAMLISELRKHAVLLANSSGNNLTPIYYSVQPTLSGGKGDFQHFTHLLKVFH